MQEPVPTLAFGSGRGGKSAFCYMAEIGNDYESRFE